MLKLLYWNPGGIRGRVRELTTLAQSQDVHIILLGETKLVDHQELRVPNYYVYRRDEISPLGRAYRGTAALVRRDIVHEELEHAPYRSLRTQGVRVRAGKKELNIYAAYRPPSETFCSTDVHTLFDQHGHLPTLVVGDLNAKHQAWGSRINTTTGRMLLEDSEREGYGILGPGSPTNIPSNPCHQPDVLDIVLHHQLDHPISVETLYDLDTEHLPILVTLNLQRDFTIPRPPRTNTNWEKYAAALSELKLVGPIKTTADVDQAAVIITAAIQHAKDEATITLPHAGRRDLLSRSLRDKLEKKRALRKLWARTRCPKVKRDLNHLAQDIRIALDARVDDDWERTIDAASESDTTLYHLCKTLTKSDTPVYPLLDRQGRRRYSAADRAEIMAEYMESQFTPNPPANTAYRHHAAIDLQIEDFLSAQTPPLRGDQFISPSELRKAVFRLPKRKAPGNDRVPIAALQQLPRRCLVALTRLFNGVLRTSHFPETWKLGRVITIPKPGKDRRLPGSYRPITLLPHIAKLFERLLLRRLAPHVTPRPEQFGFRSNHSTTLQLARGLNHIASEKNKGHCTVGVFLDIEKAFDRVWHAGLLAKLLSTNLPPAIVRLVASFLEGRSFYVSVEGVDSQPRPIRAGVPQGSCLSPCLYAVYTDDIPTLAGHLREGEEDVLLSLYADDSAYFASSYHQIVATNRMQRLLDRLPEWLDKWRMAVNVGKTAAILFGVRKPLRQLRLRGQDIEWQTSVCYLGCRIDVSLNMVPMVNHAVDHAKAASSMLYQVFTSTLTPKTKLRVYGAYVRSRLTYAAPAWYSLCSEYQRSRLQVQQSKCLRLIVGAPRYVRNDVIHRDLRMPTVEEYVRMLAQRMFARADYGPYEHLHGIAPMSTRPPTGRPLPRELLRPPSLARHACDPSDDDDDAYRT